MALIYCSNCGKEISDRSDTCPKCGAKVIISTISNNIESRTNDNNIEYKKEPINTNENKGKDSFFSNDSLDIIEIIVLIISFLSLFLEAIYARIVLLGKTYKTFNLSLITSKYGKIILAAICIDIIAIALIKYKKISIKVNYGKVLIPVVIGICLIRIPSNVYSIYVSSKNYIYVSYESGFYLSAISVICLLVIYILRIIDMNRKTSSTIQTKHNNNNNVNNVLPDM